MAKKPSNKPQSLADWMRLFSDREAIRGDRRRKIANYMMHHPDEKLWAYKVAYNKNFQSSARIQVTHYTAKTDLEYLYCYYKDSSVLERKNEREESGMIRSEDKTPPRITYTPGPNIYKLAQELNKKHGWYSQLLEDLFPEIDPDPTPDTDGGKP